MAKETKLNVFAKTDTSARGQAPGANADLDAGNIKAVGVGLRAGEVAALDAIAGELGIARNALIRFAVRWFILEVRAGRVELGGYVEQPPPPKKNLRLP